MRRVGLMLACWLAGGHAMAQSQTTTTLETEFLRYSLSADWKSTESTDRGERRPALLFDLFGPPPGPPAKPETKGGAQ